MNATSKTPGQQAYEHDVKHHPHYQEGGPRRSWDDLPEYSKWSWENKAKVKIA